MVAAIAFVAYAARAGAIVNFFSETVLVGFKCGVALLPGEHAAAEAVRLQREPRRLLGAHGPFPSAACGTRTPRRSRSASPRCRPRSLGKRSLKNRPVALFVVVGGIVAARLLHLDARGVALLGEVPQGLPMPALPPVSRADLNALLPLAMACFVLAAVETSAIGRMFAAKHGYRLDATQEFLAIGVANLAAGLGRGLPVSGGMSQSLVNESGRRADAALGAGRGAHHARRRRCSSPGCCGTFRSRCWRRSCSSP